MVIEHEIVEWYKNNKRDLPWRKTKDPYKIWISEVILQQTRVDQALDYYEKFLMKFPDIFALASSSEDDVLKIWQGLGYYTRARNLHLSAKHIARELNGIFPSTYDKILKLKGIGEYTAAAIASFVYHEKVPVLDGNVYRVLSRLFAIRDAINSLKGKKIFRELANNLILSQDAAVFNQAIMEFGALQCVPKNPDCINCPLNITCQANALKQVKDFPVKKKAEKMKDRYFSYFFIKNQEFTYIRKRDKNDIWKGLFEFPLIETGSQTEFNKLAETQEWKSLFGNSKVVLNGYSGLYIHLLSHQKIHAVFYCISCYPDLNLPLSAEGYQKIPIVRINQFAVPKLIENYLVKLEK